MNYKSYFKNKKITVLGLGLLGRGMGDVKFLAECGADLIVTDLKTKEQLRPSLTKLKKFSNIKYHLGGHKLEDFRNRDLIIKAARTPLDSPFIAEARKNNIPVEMSTALFAGLSGTTIVGITGTRGKSTTTHLIYHILKAAKKRVYLGGNVKGISTLALLKKTKPGDIAVLELDSWQLQGFGEMKISPHIAVFTNLLQDHLDYYKNSPRQYFLDKANIFKFQNKNDFTIANKPIASKIRTKGKLIIPKPLPASYKLNLLGEHNRENAALAVEAAKLFDIDEKIIKRGLETFFPLPGRLEFLTEIKGIKIYNDNNSTTPEATIAALRALGNLKSRKLVLILGGDEKQLNMRSLIEEIPKWCSGVVLFKERGTNRIRDEIFALAPRVKAFEEEGLKATVERAFGIAAPGDTILYSPAFSSFGKYFKNEYDRGEKFKKLVQNLK